MTDFNAEQFVKDRHKAFADVLYNDSMEELTKCCKKYGMWIPGGANAKWIMTAGVLKAIQECTDFSEEDKTLALQKAVAMGTNPFLRPYDYDHWEDDDD